MLGFGLCGSLCFLWSEDGLSTCEPPWEISPRAVLGRRLPCARPSCQTEVLGAIVSDPKLNQVAVLRKDVIPKGDFT